MAVLQAVERQEAKHSGLRRLREEGQIPAVIYGSKIESKPVHINGADLIKTIQESGLNGILTLQVNNQNYSVMVHELQRDPLKREILHADFQVVDMSEEVEVDVNIRLVGDPRGVKDGGVLQQQIHQISVHALPANIPSSIEVDVSQLNVGDTILVEDIQPNGKFTVNQEQSQVLASVLPPKQEEEIDPGEEQEEGIPDNLEGREQ